MNFIVQSTTLLKQLQNISGVLSNNPSLPILENFLFEISGGELLVSASDLETTMNTKIPVKAEEPGAIAVPAKLLLETLKTFPDIPLNFNIDQKNFGIEISAGEGKYKLIGQNPEEFPKTPAVEPTNSIEINSYTLATAINKCIFAAGNDDLRPVMTGIFFQFSPEDLTFVATDAHKLVKYKRTDIKANNASSFILPKKPLNLLKNILSSEETLVKVNYNNLNAHFTVNQVNLVCRLIDGKYPNYEAVIPKENPNKLTIGRSEFANSVKRVSIFANKTTHQVRLKIAGSQLSISAEDLDFSNEANERLNCSYSGEDMEIGFNSKFLQEMLNNISSDEVTIELSAPNRAGIIVPAEKEIQEEDLLMLVMPVMLNN